MKKLISSGIITLIILFLGSVSAFAQDIIFKKNKEEIKCKVIEVGINEIKCKLENNPDGPVFVYRKDEIWKIKYENGTETIITADKYADNHEQAILDKKSVLKYEVFSPSTGKLSFGYEHVLKVGTNLEGRIGIIGPHTNGDNDHASGAFIKAGIKFLAGQDFYIDGMRYAHPLKGRYVKFELMYSSFTTNPEFYDYNTNSNSTYHTTNNAASLNICLGKQWILANTLTLDLYAGIGYGISSVKIRNAPSDINPEDTQYFYSHFGGTNSMPITWTGGFSLGYILK